MLRNGMVISRSIIFIFILTSGVFAQAAREPYAIKQSQAREAVLKKDFESAIRLYSEAIVLFPKFDEYTPQPNGPGAPDVLHRYDDLRDLYLGRFRAYLHKGLEMEAQADLTRSLIVIKAKIDRSLNEGKALYSKVDIDAERRIKRPSVHNSTLLEAGSVFSIVVSTCRTVRSIYRDDPRLVNSIPKRFLLDERDVNALASIDATCQEARFARANVAATAMIDVQNRSQNFIALSLANELVIDFPNNADAYRLRARVNKYLGDEKQSTADEEKANELVRRS